MKGKANTDYRGDFLSKYIVLEIGESARTEFLMKNGEYEETEDAIVIGIIDADSEDKAIAVVHDLEYCKSRKFDTLVVHRLFDKCNKLYQ